MRPAAPLPTFHSSTNQSTSQTPPSGSRNRLCPHRRTCVLGHSSSKSSECRSPTSNDGIHNGEDWYTYRLPSPSESSTHDLPRKARASENKDFRPDEPGIAFLIQRFVQPESMTVGTEWIRNPVWSRLKRRRRRSSEREWANVTELSDAVEM